MSYPFGLQGSGWSIPPMPALPAGGGGGSLVPWNPSVSSRVGGAIPQGPMSQSVFGPYGPFTPNPSYPAGPYGPFNPNPQSLYASRGYPNASAGMRGLQSNVATQPMSGVTMGNPTGMQGPIGTAATAPPPAAKATGLRRFLPGSGASGAAGAGSHVFQSGPMGRALSGSITPKGLAKGFGAGLAGSIALGVGSDKLNQWAGIGDYGLRTDPRGEFGQSLVLGAEQGAGLGAFFGPAGAFVGGAGLGIGNAAAQPVQALLGRDPSEYSIGNVFDNTLGKVPGGGAVQDLLGIGGNSFYVDENGQKMDGQTNLAKAAEWQKKMGEAKTPEEKAAAQDMAWQYQEAAAGRRASPDAADAGPTPEAQAKRAAAMSPEGMSTLMGAYGLDSTVQSDIMQTLGQQRVMLDNQLAMGAETEVQARDDKGQPKFEKELDADGKKVPVMEVRKITQDDVDTQLYNQFLELVPAMGAQQQADSEMARKTALQQATIAQYMNDVSGPGNAIRDMASQYMSQSVGSLPASMQGPAAAYNAAGLAGSQNYQNALVASAGYAPQRAADEATAAYNNQMNSQLQQALIQQQLAQQYPELFGPKTQSSGGSIDDLLNPQ